MTREQRGEGLSQRPGARIRIPGPALPGRVWRRPGLEEEIMQAHPEPGLATLELDRRTRSWTESCPCPSKCFLKSPLLQIAGAVLAQMGELGSGKSSSQEGGNPKQSKSGTETPELNFTKTLPSGSSSSIPRLHPHVSSRSAQETATSFSGIEDRMFPRPSRTTFSSILLSSGRDPTRTQATA